MDEIVFRFNLSNGLVLPVHDQWYSFTTCRLCAEVLGAFSGMNVWRKISLLDVNI